MSRKIVKNNSTTKTPAPSAASIQPTAAPIEEKVAAVQEKVSEVKEVKAVQEEKENKSVVKPAPKKTTPKTTAKTVVKETKAPTEQIYVQFAGNEYDTAVLMDKVREAWVHMGHKVSSIKSINLYIKPEEYAAYYVINQKECGKILL